MDGGHGRTIVAVKIDRCWNRYWRCFLFIGIVSMACITGAMWMSMRRNAMEGLLDTSWRTHFSSKDTYSGRPEKASKTVIEQVPADDGSRISDVQVQQETMQEYFGEESYPQPDDVGYYDVNHPDRPRNQRLSADYVAQYAEDVRSSRGNRTSRVDILNMFAPKLTNYSLQPNFGNIFRDLTDEDIEFDESYTNPCWGEAIPRYPYANNSYLLVSAQARELEPQFQAMRKRFASLQEKSVRWRLRCLPAFYVMETPPLATPDLFTVLSYHPSVSTPQLKEPEFWNLKGPEGLASFRDYLDLFDAPAQEIRDKVDRAIVEGKIVAKHKKITGEGTSSYLWTFDSWQKVKGNEGETEPKVTAADMIYKLTPLAKFVFILRNPTERLFQGYLSRTDAPSASDFHDKAGKALEKMEQCEKTRSLRSCLYDGPLNKNLPVRLRIGMYYPFIYDWVRVFPMDQIKVIRYEDFVASPSEVINDVCKFLGLSPFPTDDLAATEERIRNFEKRRLSNQKVQMLSATRAMLKEFHRHMNGELAALLEDDKFTWPELALPLDQSPANTLSAEELLQKQRKEKEKIQAEAQAIHEQRQKQMEEQRKRMEEYLEKQRRWAAEQQQLRQKMADEREKQEAEKEKQDAEKRAMQNQQQQPQQQQQQQQQQPQQQPGQQQPLQQINVPNQQQQQQQQQPKQWQGPNQPSQSQIAAMQKMGIPPERWNTFLQRRSQAQLRGGPFQGQPQQPAKSGGEAAVNGVRQQLPQSNLAGPPQFRGNEPNNNPQKQPVK